MWRHTLADVMHVFVAASLSVRTNVRRVAVAFGDLWGVGISCVCKRTTAIVISTGVREHDTS